MATVRVRVGKDGTRRWQVRYFGSDGREHAQTFHRKTDADRFVSTVETDKLRGDWVDPKLGNITLRAWLERVAATRVLKPKTTAGYTSLMRHHVLPVLGDRQIRAIKPSDVQAFVAGLEQQGLSRSRVRQAYQQLDATLEAAVKDNRLVRNPCIKIDLPKVTRRKEGHIGAAQLAALANESGAYLPLVLLLGYSGMRWGEAVALRVRSIDFLAGKIHVSESMAEVGGALHFGTTKTGRNRTVRIPRAVLDLLEEQVEGKGPDDLVFTRSDGGPLRHANFRMRVWLPALRAARLPADMRIHDLRHTCDRAGGAPQGDPGAARPCIDHE